MYKHINDLRNYVIGIVYLLREQQLQFLAQLLEALARLG